MQFSRIYITIIFIIFIFLYNFTLLGLHTSSYIFNIEIPQPGIKSLPLCGYYKGYKLTFEHATTIISQNTSCSRFVIAITPKVRSVPFKHNKALFSIERIAGEPCKLFYVTKDYISQNSPTNKWHIEEEAFENIPLRLPDSALIFLFNPDFVETLRQPQLTNNNVIYLPSIVIKSEIPAELINKAAIYSTLASLDSNTIHVPYNRSFKLDRSGVLCITHSKK